MMSSTAMNILLLEVIYKPRRRRKEEEVLTVSAEIVVRTVRTDIPKCKAQRPTCFSEGRCNVMSDVHVQLPIENQNSEEENNMPYLPLDQAVPTYVLGRRRHGISIGCESPYCSRPRMKRRGAVSYETSDTAAEYIRYLGTKYCMQALKL